jgi:hypothetical protein
MTNFNEAIQIIKIMDLCKIVYGTVKLVNAFQMYIVQLEHKWNLV